MQINGQTKFSKHASVFKSSSKKPISKFQNSIPKQKTPAQIKEELKSFDHLNRLDPQRRKAPNNSENFSTKSSSRSGISISL